jgi:hypothetical protein
MGLLSDTTYLHMEVASAIDHIHRLLQRYRRAPSDEATIREFADELLAVVDPLPSLLQTHHQREIRDLYPRVERIIARDLEELRQLQSSADTVLETLQSFRQEVLHLQEEPPSHLPVRIVYLEMLFEEFVAHYEERREVEMIFYRTVSNLLYPGGLTAD